MVVKINKTVDHVGVSATHMQKAHSRGFHMIRGLATAFVLITACNLIAGGDPSGSRHEVQTASDVHQPTLLFDPAMLPGRYVMGDGLGVNCSLTLGEDHRFAFSWRGCGGEYDRNAGTWSLEGDVVVMEPEQPNRMEGFQGMNVRFIPVSWGKCVFLVDENEMPGFCAAAADPESLSFRGVRGHDYIKRGMDDDGSRPDGRPEVPDRYAEYLELGPVTARVVEVRHDGAVVLESKDAHRIREGMLLTLTSFGRLELEVTSLIEGGAVAEVHYFWNSGHETLTAKRFTTGDELHRVRGTGFERFKQPPSREVPDEDADKE